MTLADDTPGVAAVFDELERVHVYDHERDRWLMSGADFGGRVALEYLHDDDDDDLLVLEGGASSVTEGEDDLTLVREDNAADEYSKAGVDMDVASEAASVVADAVAELEGVDRGRVRVASLTAPNEVRYFLEPEGADE